MTARLTFAVAPHPPTESVSVDATGREEDSALHLACLYGHADVAKVSFRACRVRLSTQSVHTIVVVSEANGHALQAVVSDFAPRASRLGRRSYWHGVQM